MYISAMKNNLVEEQKKAISKLGKKWKSESEMYIEDYFEQLQRAVKIRKKVIANLTKADLNTDVSFVEYRSGRKIS